MNVVRYRFCCHIIEGRHQFRTEIRPISQENPPWTSTFTVPLLFVTHLSLSHTMSVDKSIFRRTTWRVESSRVRVFSILLIFTTVFDRSPNVPRKDVNYRDVYTVWPAASQLIQAPASRPLANLSGAHFVVLIKHYPLSFSRWSTCLIIHSEPLNGERGFLKSAPALSRHILIAFNREIPGGRQDLSRVLCGTE